jgi:hypothetical protein
MPQRPPTEAEFWARSEPDGDCLVWTRAKFAKGYGRVKMMGEVAAHRVAYKLAYGDIPEGMLVCHTCDRRDCVQPEHLFVGDQGDNMRDMASKGRAAGQIKEHCVSGHAFTPENTCVDRAGKRSCLACRRRRDKERYWRDKEARRDS